MSIYLNTQQCNIKVIDSEGKSHIVHEVLIPEASNAYGIITHDNIYYLDCALHVGEEPFALKPLIYDTTWKNWAESESEITINAWMPRRVYQMPNNMSTGYITNLKNNYTTAIYRKFTEKWDWTTYTKDTNIFEAWPRGASGPFLRMYLTTDSYEVSTLCVEYRSQASDTSTRKQYYYWLGEVGGAGGSFKPNYAIVWVHEGIHVMLEYNINRQTQTFSGVLDQMTDMYNQKCNLTTFPASDMYIDAVKDDSLMLIGYSQHQFPNKDEPVFYNYLQGV